MGISHIWKLTICVAITRTFEGRLKENSVKIRLLRSPKNRAIAPRARCDGSGELARHVTRGTAATSWIWAENKGELDAAPSATAAPRSRAFARSKQTSPADAAALRPGRPASLSRFRGRAR